MINTDYCSTHRKLSCDLEQRLIPEKLLPPKAFWGAAENREKI